MCVVVRVCICIYVRCVYEVCVGVNRRWVWVQIDCVCMLIGSVYIHCVVVVLDVDGV